MKNNDSNSDSDSNGSSEKQSHNKSSEQPNEMNLSHQTEKDKKNEGQKFEMSLNNEIKDLHDNKKNNDDNTRNISIIIEKLEAYYKNSRGEKRISSFQKLINKQDMTKILEELSKRNLEDILVYILKNFTPDSKYNGIEGYSDLNEDNEREKNVRDYKDLVILAVKNGQIHVLEALEKIDLNFTMIKDSEDNNGLLLAVIYSNIQIAKFFLKNCPDMIESTNKKGYSPLLLAVYNNDNLMFFLLANNMDNVIKDGNQLYELAIRNENLDIINYLNYKNKNKCDFKPSRELLHFAVCQSNLEVFRAIASIWKEYDYSIETTKETPLHWAAMKGNYYIVKELIKLYKENQIELDKKNQFGVTPFMLANLRQDKNICELFYENGVDVNEQDIEGNSIAHLIAGLGDVKWLKYMIKKFNVNCYLKNNKGNTPFIHAILNENVACVEFFIELFKNSKQLVSTNINWRNKYGQTPLHAAVFTGKCRIIEVLLRNKADISVFDANDLTPYHYAYILEKEDVIKTIHDTLGIDKFDFMKK
jgi:ankyrin repeat protein